MGQRTVALQVGLLQSVLSFLVRLEIRVECRAIVAFAGGYAYAYGEIAGGSAAVYAIIPCAT